MIKTNRIKLFKLRELLMKIRFDFIERFNNYFNRIKRSNWKGRI